MASTKDVKDMADRLISTLDSSMSGPRADAIVRDVAEQLYTEVLGIKGHIVVDREQPTGIVHGGFGPNGKRAAMQIAKYKFERSE